MIWFYPSTYSKAFQKYQHNLDKRCVSKKDADGVVISGLVYGDNIMGSFYFYMTKKEYESLPSKERTHIIETQILPAYCRTFKEFKDSKKLEIYPSYVKDYFWIKVDYEEKEIEL